MSFTVNTPINNNCVRNIKNIKASKRYVTVYHEIAIQTGVNTNS